MSTKVELLDRIRDLECENTRLRNMNEKLQQNVEELERTSPNHWPYLKQERNSWVKMNNNFWYEPSNKFWEVVQKHSLNTNYDIRFPDIPWMAAEELDFGGNLTHIAVEYRDTEETKQKVKEMAALIETLEQKLETVKAPLVFVVEAIKNKAKFVNPAAAYELFEQMDYIFKDCKPWNANVGQLKEFLLREKDKALLPPPSSAIRVTDEQMADAISSINGEGLPLDEKQKWMGVCCLARARYGYPYDFEACCNRLAKLPYKKPLYKECDWGNVRKLAGYSFCQEPYDKWRNYCPKNSESKHFDSCFYVARSLEEELEKLQNNAFGEY